VGVKMRCEEQLCRILEDKSEELQNFEPSLGSVMWAAFGTTTVFGFALTEDDYGHSQTVASTDPFDVISLKYVILLTMSSSNTKCLT